VQYVIIRYSLMYYRGLFLLKDDLEVHPGDLCIARSPRGIEMGKVLSEPLEHNGEVLWLKNSKTHGEKEKDNPDLLSLSGEVIRKATEEDINSVQEHFARGTHEEETFCHERIKANSMPMKLAGVEYLFEGEKIIFYFLADGRVDFRVLVKDLAKQYRTRIEMKQLGVRDAARLLAEYEPCGRRLCCKGFLNNLEPVTMKMAKSQKTTLDPAKISGRCGRLMCCLRYENHVYRELKANLPRKNTIVVLKSGRAKVLNHDVLLQRVLVETEARVVQYIQASEIIEMLPKGELLPPKAIPKAHEKRKPREAPAKPRQKSSKRPSKPEGDGKRQPPRKPGPKKRRGRRPKPQVKPDSKDTGQGKKGKPGSGPDSKSSGPSRSKKEPRN